MMTDCFSFMSTNGMSWMLWGAGFFWLLVLILLGFATAALIKYLRSDGNANTQRERMSAHAGHTPA
jgi:hypothetical protein